MEEIPAKGGWLYRNRKPMAVIIIMAIVFPFAIVISNLSYDSDTEYELSYSLTVWILPLEEEFAVHLDIYSSQLNAVEQVNKFQGIQFEVQPSDEEEHNFFLVNLPDDLLGFSVRISFDSQDDKPFTILKVDIGQKATTSLLGREISMRIQPYLG
jgi:hypothetical protein